VLARLICIQWDNASSKAVTTPSDVRTRPVVHAGIARVPHRHAHAVFSVVILNSRTLTDWANPRKFTLGLLRVQAV
jgi:hypothetical protein